MAFGARAELCLAAINGALLPPELHISGPSIIEALDSFWSCWVTKGTAESPEMAVSLLLGVY